MPGIQEVNSIVALSEIKSTTTLPCSLPEPSRRTPYDHQPRPSPASTAAYVAYLIDSGIASVPEIMAATGMPAYRPPPSPRWRNWTSSASSSSGRVRATTRAAMSSATGGGTAGVVAEQHERIAAALEYPPAATWLAGEGEAPVKPSLAYPMENKEKRRSRMDAQELLDALRKLGTRYQGSWPRHSAFRCRTLTNWKNSDKKLSVEQIAGAIAKSRQAAVKTSPVRNHPTCRGVLRDRTLPFAR